MDKKSKATKLNIIKTINSIKQKYRNLHQRRFNQNEESNLIKLKSPNKKGKIFRPISTSTSFSSIAPQRLSHSLNSRQGQMDIDNDDDDDDNDYDNYDDNENNDSDDSHNYEKKGENSQKRHRDYSNVDNWMMSYQESENESQNIESKNLMKKKHDREYSISENEQIEKKKRHEQGSMQPRPKLKPVKKNSMLQQLGTTPQIEKVPIETMLELVRVEKPYIPKKRKYQTNAKKVRVKKLTKKLNRNRKNYRDSYNMVRPNIPNAPNASKIVARIESNDLKNDVNVTGSGIANFNKKIKKSNTFTYWDDPNELVARLMLLTASKSAGHTSHNNEIISIVEELKEANIIF